LKSIVNGDTHITFALLIVSVLTFLTPLIVPERIGQNAVINITNTEQLSNVGSSAIAYGMNTTGGIEPKKICDMFADFSNLLIPSQKES